ncbi:hypothetical protein PACTADRAFT_50723 [Pachysolen tannophilus NRRL Y-2460]|uniref:Protein-serine/threonine kinase n=1 Tax=Pachysolen tannophilus NRRL Y-2460 TaxID=669874 RepID=A0A1E4TSZ2_PACTA|nr:hypothetical protein PACTADRAFT_50723 [Pachysolen tannophilus NRRL Y-2460]
MMSSTAWKLTPKLRQEIYNYAKLQPTGVSLKDMVKFGPKPSAGTLFHASQFVVQELPVRLAHRVKELEELPYGLSDNASILKVKDWYSQSFEELTTLQPPKIDGELKELLYKNGSNDFHIPLQPSAPPEPTKIGPEKRIFEDDGLIIRKPRQHLHVPAALDFTSSGIQRTKSYYIYAPSDIVYPAEVYNYNKLVTETLKKIKKRHDATVTTVARGVQEWKRSNKNLLIDSQIQNFLDAFYLSRIGIRMLIGQQIAINQDYSALNDDYVGIICLNTNISDIVNDAIDSARFVCEEHYGLFEAPKVQLYCPEELNFMYVPGHLLHMLFETLKNSLRATVEHQIKKYKDMDIDDIKYPPIRIIVAEGNEDITIKISDEGGGIARSAIPLIWTYLYTTVDALPNVDPDVTKTDARPPMAGYGYGLPLSRLYAKYFGGDLKLISMEGYGTDVYLHLNKLSSSSEPLP